MLCMLFGHRFQSLKQITWQNMPGPTAADMFYCTRCLDWAVRYQDRAGMWQPVGTPEPERRRLSEVDSPATSPL